MATKVLAPRLGEGVNELTIVRWLKHEGESINELESLLEVETDKVVTEIPSPASGVLLKCVISENNPVNVGSIIAWIGQPGEKIDATPLHIDAVPLPDTHEREILFAASITKPASGMQDPRHSTFISPVVSKIARENKVDLQRINGTGLNGRITKKDILDFVSSVPPVISPYNAQISQPPQPKPSTGDKVIPHSIIRKSIAEHMLVSKQTSPHVLTVMEADLSKVIAHRNANKERFLNEGINLTITPYFILAIAAGLKAYPLVNSSWSDAGLILHGACNIGMATSLGEEGLIVPVIKSADHLSLSGVAAAVNDLSSRARSKKLQPDEVKDGTFTLTNHGISGSLFAMPIINQPQCGILGVGAIQKRVIVVTDKQENDSIAIRPMVYLSFVFDHRILDGAIADGFLMQVVNTLEQWQ
jgi:pyruvate/2-oxoglutarate dehydrogenase complex dihydrolipoamide acyltransferase (E2) component